MALNSPNKVFLTGATGVLGTAVARMLIDTGHAVRALARNAGAESRLREAGLEPVQASLFDLPSLLAAVKGCDAVLHLATRIPRPNRATARGAWDENDRIRIEGTRNLVDAALECGVSTVIYPSIVFVYADGGPNWLEAATAATKPSRITRSSLKAESEVERFARPGRRGIVLRMGGFYGPTAPNTHHMLRTARRYGIAMLVGRSTAYQPLIWVDDAAVAVVDAMSKAPSGIYDIVDDEPLQRRELAKHLARAAGRKWVFRPPTILFRFLAGKDAMFLTRSHRVSNRRFKEETGWSPTVPDGRVGFQLLTILP